MPLHLHPHDFLIGGNNFVANLHQHVEFEIGALHGQHRGMQIVAVAGQKVLDALIGVVTGAFHLVDGALQDVAEFAAAGGGEQRRRFQSAPTGWMLDG